MELHQQAKNGEQRHFALKDGRELHVTLSKKHKTSRYALSILAMIDRGKRLYQFKKSWLLLGVASIGMMLLLPKLDTMLDFELTEYVLYIHVGLFFIALLFFMLLVNSFHQRYVFLSVHTKLPLVELWVNKPSRREFQKFVSTLETSISQHKEIMHVPFSRQLAGEIRTLRRVAEAGMLSESVYQAAKAKLLIMSDANYRPSHTGE